MNRRNFALASAALLPATAATLLASEVDARRGTPDKRRGPRTKIVTRTFSNDRRITLPGAGTSGPASPYPSTIDVEGLTRGRILDVNLTLHGFSHGYPEDIDVMLVAPNGRAAIVMSEAGGDGFPVSGVTITLDDQASRSLPRSQALTSGSYRPANHDDFEPETFPAPAPQGITTTALATFQDINPNGKWKLFVVDDAVDDNGRITNGWSLTITAKVTVRKKRR